MTKANGDLQAVILVGPGDRLYPFVDEAMINFVSNCGTSSNSNNTAGPSGTAGATSGTTGNIGTTSTAASTSNPSLTAQAVSVNPTSSPCSNSSASNSNYSKALLPICNRPMIYYPLTWLIQSGIGEIIIVVQQKFQSKVANYINRQYEFAEGTKIEVVPAVQNGGSLAVLLSIRHKLKGDFLVLSCDLITDAPLSKMADLHRSKGAMMTCLFSGPQASGLLSNSPTTGNSDSTSLADPRYLASLAGEELLVALDMSSMSVVTDSSHSVSTCNLIFCAPQADSLDETNSHLPIKMSTLFRYPKMRLRTDLFDPHCYMFSTEIFGMIEEIIGSSVSENQEDAGQELNIPASLFSIREDLIPKILRRVHRFHSSEGILKKPSSTFAVIVDSGNYCLRANTLPALLESTRQLLKSSAIIASSVKVAASAEISPRSQVGNDSLFGDGSRLGERSSIKKSVVGSNCSVGNNVKVVNCILMDGAVIEDGCKLDGCIIGPKATLREKCQLKDCDVAGCFELPRESVAKGETFGSNRELVEDLY